jgi:hypothetical protein
MRLIGDLVSSKVEYAMLLMVGELWIDMYGGVWIWRIGMDGWMFEGKREEW